MTEEDKKPEGLKGVGSGPPEDWKVHSILAAPNGKTIGKVYLCDMNFPAIRVDVDKEHFVEYEKLEYILISDDEHSLLFKFVGISKIKGEYAEVIKIDVTTKAKNMECFRLEKELKEEHGIKFDTGYALGSKQRDWELDTLSKSEQDIVNKHLQSNEILWDSFKSRLYHVKEKEKEEEQEEEKDESN